jgi:predicted NAD/FAD-dependent oxidoreductase
LRGLSSNDLWCKFIFDQEADMPVVAENSVKSRTKTAPPRARVAVVGGGIAGLACALRLAQNGCQVTIYEAADRLGGNLSSSGAPQGPRQDVYPHIFPDWYANFWSLIEDDLGLKREENFAARWAVGLLEKPPSAPPPTHQPPFLTLDYTPTLDSVVTTLKSGVLPYPDAFLFAFINLDLAAQPPDSCETDMLCQLDVNGYFYSRNYSTEAIGALQDEIISAIWSVPSDMTSAKVYKNFIKHQLSSLGPKTPYAWLLKGPLQTRIIEPLERKLTGKGGGAGPALDCRIETGVRVDSVEVPADGTPRIMLRRAAPSGRRSGPEEAPPADYVVIATPGTELAEMVMRGRPGQRLVDKVPDLAQVRRVWGEAIPVVNLYFKRKLKFMPQEIVVLRDSGYELTMLDISQLWDGDDKIPDVTALVLAASNSYALTSEDARAQGYLMIKRLREYLYFDLGEAWGQGEDIDWTRTTVRRNEHHLLFVNDVGSRVWRPNTAYAQLPGVFFAGDVCKTDVDMATVEAAIQSGVMAARAVQQAELAPGGKRRMPDTPIALAPHRVYSDATFLAAKLALLPAAYSAAALSAFREALTNRTAKGGYLPAYVPAARAILLPLDYTVDWWRTAYWLARSLSLGAKEGSVEGVDPADTAIGFGVKGFWESGEPKAPRPRAGRPHDGRLISAAGALVSELGRALQGGGAAHRRSH